MPITNPARELGDPDQVVRRRTPFYPPGTITALEDYVEGLTGGGGPPIPTVDPHANRADGGEVFRLQCAACHAWAGDGGALLHREAPSLHLGPFAEGFIAWAVGITVLLFTVRWIGERK